MRTIDTQQVIHRVGIDEIIKTYDDGTPNFFEDILGETVTNKQAFHRVYERGDFGYATVVGEGEPGEFDDFRLPYTMDVTALKRQIGWSASTESLESDIMDILSDALPMLKHALRMTKEQAVANQINNFTSTSAPYNTPDGDALISTSHSIETGDTGTNRPAADIALSAAALEQALQELTDQVTQRGLPFPQMGPFDLIVPNELQGLAYRLINTTQIPQSANNDVNWAKTRIRFSGSNPWLTDANNWALQVSDKSRRVIKMLVRRAPTFKRWEDPNLDAVLHSVNEIYTCYNAGWRGFWGTAPA